jgi:hypothetical protein
MKKALDVGAEAGEIRAAVDGVRLLTDMLATDAVPDGESARQLPRSASALLNLIGTRLKACAQALNGSKDAAELVEHFNRSLGDGGTTIAEWSAEKREREAQRELRRVAHERRSRRRR